MNFTVRSAQFIDCPALAKLLREIGWFKAINGKTHAEAITHVESHLAECLADESHSVYVSVDEDAQVVGYVSVHWLAYLFMAGPEGFISELFVSPSARGQGVGTALLETVKEQAEERSCYRLSLLNGKDRESYDRKFYEKQGWEERPGMSNFVYLLPNE